MSNSALPVLWAMKHAPVANALERLILIAMADAADSDGCNSYRSKRTLSKIAVGVDEETIRRHQRVMEQRGLIRPDTTPPQSRYLRIPANRRPRRWEVCIPYSWWTDEVRAELQEERAELGLPPLTPQTRPDLNPAPSKKPRADKGKPNPNRRPKKAREQGDDGAPESGVLSERGQESDLRGLSERGPGASQRGVRGPLREDQPSFDDLPVEPSPSCVAGAPQDEVQPGATVQDGGRRDSSKQTDNTESLVGEVVALRPDWRREKVRAALQLPGVLERPRSLWRAAFLTIAADPNTQYPGRLAHDGPWWTKAVPKQTRRTTDLDPAAVVELAARREEAQRTVDASSYAAAVRAQLKRG